MKLYFLIVFSAVFGGLFGLVFSALVVYAIEIALIISAIGIASSVAESLEAFLKGDSYQGCGYAFLSLLGLSGIKNCLASILTTVKYKYADGDVPDWNIVTG